MGLDGGALLVEGIVGGALELGFEPAGRGRKGAARGQRCRCPDSTEAVHGL